MNASFSTTIRKPAVISNMLYLFDCWTNAAGRSLSGVETGLLDVLTLPPSHPQTQFAQAYPATGDAPSRWV